MAPPGVCGYPINIPITFDYSSGGAWVIASPERVLPASRHPNWINQLNGYKMDVSGAVGSGMVVRDGG